MQYKRYIFLFTIFFISLSTSVFSENTLRLYLDADRSGAKASGLAIEQGIRLALSEIDYRIGDYKMEIIIQDHHGNSRRSSIHINEFINDPDALAMYCGLHSPPVLSNLDLIQENDVLLMDPWAAAGPITRTPGSDGENWIFRLSVDDTKAGEVIVSHACDTEGYRKPVLLLEDTGWGRSNKATMTKALSDRGMEAVDIIWFNWNIGDNGARVILQDIHAMGADVILLVANAPEGKTFLRAMADRNGEKKIPVRSHWGITGGDLFETLGAETLVETVDLQFLQTTFSFMNPGQTEFSREVFSRAAALFPEISEPKDIRAPAGFIHAYDITRILISALHQSGLSGSTADIRSNVREALENLQQPVRGLIKEYRTPFGPYSENSRSAHEALDKDDFTMAYYDAEGSIVLIEETP